MPSDETAKSQPFTPQEHERIRAQIRVRGITFEVFLLKRSRTGCGRNLRPVCSKIPARRLLSHFQDMRELDRHPSIRQELFEGDD